MPENSLTVGKALGGAYARLKSAEILSFRLDSELLLAKCLQTSREKIIAYPERTLTPLEEQEFAAMLTRRSNREPVSYLLGMREFWGLEFRVNAHVLDPRPESEILIEAVVKRVKGKDLRILDLGTGSGCLLLSLLHELSGAHGVGVDLSEDALAVASANGEALGLSSRVQWLRGDWGMSIAGVFDVIVSNPPYIPAGEIALLEPEVKNYEPRSALVGGEDGLECYRAIAPQVKRLLKQDGIACLEMGQGQGDRIAEIMNQYHLNIQARIADLSGIERCLVITH